jgi:hypothetical protein
VAVTKCNLKLRSIKFIAACETAFVEFEQILRERPDSEIKYEWGNVYRRDLLVTFDVNWYDIEFFQDRKNAYRVGPHAFVFQRFGAVADDFVLRHHVSAPRSSGRLQNVSE